jgi:trimeric autotransporter adhesin
MMTLRGVPRFGFGRPRKDARTRRRALLNSTPRGVEPLEDRQLLSSFAMTHLHTSALAPNHHAIIESAQRSSSVPSVTFYNAKNTTDASKYPISGWQGIRDGDSPGQYLITGTSNATGILYIGSISGQGTSYAVNVPGASSTSVYGPNNLGGGQVQLVGSYRTADSSTVNGFFFQGTTTDDGTVTGTYRTLDYPGATYNYIHSTMGGLAVGNSDGPTANGLPLGTGHASIYDVATGELVTNITYPCSRTTSAYGIWYNGGTSYTIVGGFSNRWLNTSDQHMPIGKGYLVDYDSATGCFSHWKAFTYPKGFNILTHFQGISSPAPGVYTLSADSIQVGRTHLTQGSWVVVRRNRDGSFGNASWVNLNYPGVLGWTSNDSVAGNQVVGIVLGNTGEISYQATVNTSVKLAPVAVGRRGFGRP